MTSICQSPSVFPLSNELSTFSLSHRQVEEKEKSFTSLLALSPDQRDRGHRMISLTLIPTHRQAKIGPTHPIAGLPSSSLASTSTISSPSQEGKGLRSAFQQSRSKSEAMSPSVVPLHSTPSPAAKARLNVRLADENILLPFHNRAAEVKALLYDNKRNQELMRSFELLFSSSPESLHQIQTLLSDVDRDQMTDREWLEQLYYIIFPKSAASWCRLADCIGAHDIAWSKFSTSEPEREYFRRTDEDRGASRHARVFSEDDDETSAESAPLSSSRFEFETLDELPETFRVAPITMEKLSYRTSSGDTDQPSLNGTGQIRHRRSSSLISTGLDSSVHEFLRGSTDGFAGVRLSCPIEGRRDTSPKTEETRNRAISAPSTMRGRRSSDVSRLHKYTHHRRLSNLFMSSITDESNNRQEGSNKSPRLQWAPQSPQYSSSSREQEPVPASSSFAKSFVARARSVSSPQVTTINSPSTVLSKECTLGLLPDGRTRHPSASDGPESKEAAALLAFKNELKLSGYKQQDRQGDLKEESPTRGVALSPSLSDDSALHQDYSRSTPATSPEISKQILPPKESKAIDRPQLLRKRSAAIFAVPRSTQITRSRYLLELLDQGESTAAIDTMRSVIGEEKYQKLRQLISEKERDDLPDEALLERIGRIYFDLIDTQKDDKETIEATLCEEDYETRWDAFVKLCNVWKVDAMVLHEAKRRSGPALQLF